MHTNTRVLLQTNSFLLSEFNLETCRFFYAPVYHSKTQREFHQRRLEELQRVARVEWCESIGEEDFDIALTWDALREKSAFAQKIYPRQNRLFSRLPFKLPESFTPFRALAEKHLPRLYKDAVLPWDREVTREITYYFKERRLPLTYLETRNDLVGRDGSTKFSAYLSCGALDVRHLYNEVRRFEELHGATKSTGWIIFELLWREFFYWHYQGHPREYLSRNGLKGKFDFSEPKSYSIDKLKGLSTDSFFHAALNELMLTGFLSNRARQIFASIWINDLGLDWRSGARFFEEHLIDYDVYSNYGNWMYLAGVGVDPRGKRYFNVKKQLEQYDPTGAYLRAWLR